MSKSTIKKITIGPDIKNGFTYKVGGPLLKGSIEISTIEEVKKNEIYSIYVKKTNDPNAAEAHWKDIVGMPTTIEYNIDDY